MSKGRAFDAEMSMIYWRPRPALRANGRRGLHWDQLHMNQAAVEVFSTLGVGVLCIVLGIMALTIFFTVLGRISSAGAKPETMAVRGVLKKDTWATVHMAGAETFERVRFIGFTSTESIKTHLPYELNGMVILEDERGTRFLVRAKAIRMIVVEPSATGS